MVAAAGNDGPAPVNFPASIAEVIAVGATNADNTLASFSATGSNLDLVAPGSGILSTVAPNTTGSDSGTSFSAPMVAGVAGLIRSLSPTMTVSNVTNILNFTARDLGSTGYDTNFGFGLLNASRALLAVSSGTVFVTNPSDTEKTYPYPNPFTPGVLSSVQFSIPGNQGTLTADGVTIDIYNTAGEKIKTLNNTISWDGKNDDGNLVASGLYYYIAKSPGGQYKGKLTVIK